MRRSLLEEERRRSGSPIGGWYRISVEDVRLKAREGEDMMVVLFRVAERCEHLLKGPLYGFRMEAMEPFEASEVKGHPAHVVEGWAEEWATIVLGNLLEAVDTGRCSCDSERGVTWVR